MASVTHPNVLWIFSDQHRAQAMSCAGDPNVETPNLDRLASEGMRFTNAYANTPVCSPFRASLYTGKYIHNHGVVSLDVPLVQPQTMLAQVLRDHGYTTAHFGKWHLCGGAAPDPYVSEYFRPGWDDWLGWENSNRPFETEYCTGEERNKRKMLPGYQTDSLTDLSIDWIARHCGERPWFHVISLEPPHPPNVAPEPYMDMYLDRELTWRDNVPADHADQSLFDERLRGYYAQIRNLDDNVGRLLDTLEESGQLNNTIVFYFSDHGDFMGSHGRINKCRPEEESSNIPLLVRHPGLVPEGITSDALVSCVDLMPTLLGLLNIPVPEGVDGADLSATLFKPESRGADHVLLQYEQTFFRRTPETVYRALRTGPWLYTWRLVEGPAQLFNLEEDPYQLSNLVNETTYQTKRRKLHGKLMNVLRSQGDLAYLDRMQTQSGRENGDDCPCA